MSTTAARLTVDEVSCRYGGVRAVDHVSLQIEPHELVGIVGPNGAGKTTLLNCVSGLARVSGGRIYMNSVRLDRLAAHRIARAGVGRTFQMAGLFGDFTALEYVMLGRSSASNISVMASALSLPRVWRTEANARRHAMVALDEVGLSDVAGSRLNELPYGVQKVLDIVRARSGDNGLLLLDEPTSGTQPEDRTRLQAQLRELREKNTTVIVVDHDIEFLAGVVRRLIVMARGAVIADGPPDHVLDDPEVIRLYVGVANDRHSVGKQGNTDNAAERASQSERGSDEQA